MLAQAKCAAIHGVDVKTVEIEVTFTPAKENDKGFSINIVGLPDTVVRESRDRVLTAVTGVKAFPGGGRVMINLAPADLKKTGAGYDLSMALGLIVASEKLDLRQDQLAGYMIIGELSLKGLVRPVTGVLPIAMHAKTLGLRGMIVPAENAKEAASAQDIAVFGVHSLEETIHFLKGECPIPPTVADLSMLYGDIYAGMPDFVDVKGQEGAKRALTVAAAGNHNVLMFGPPGTGKSMLAKRLPSIMPPLSLEEALEVTKVHSIAGVLDPRVGIVVQRPFRSPHHTVSDAGLVGGQAIPKPGELSLAHCGVLFLDELPEFRRNVLEVMRQPLESGEVTISRATGSFVFPARILLIAAMNPCPCGYYGSRTHHCKCTKFQVEAYRNRISGPLLDRIDMHLEIAQLSEDVLLRKRDGANSAFLREKVLAAREIQKQRYAGTKIRCNAELSGRLMDDFCPLDMASSRLLRDIINELQLSARAYDRILRVARTLADLDGGGNINQLHINEAAGYRILDRLGW